MLQITKTRGYNKSYSPNGRNDYYLGNSGYCMQEKNILLNELYTNLMERFYERNSFSVNRTNSSWQMSK